MTFNDNEEEFNSLYFKDKELNQTNLSKLLERWNTPKQVVVPRQDMIDSMEKLRQTDPEWVLQQSLIILKNKKQTNDEILAIKTNDDFIVPVNGRLYDSIKIEAKKRNVSVDELSCFLTTIHKNKIIK